MDNLNFIYDWAGTLRLEEKGQIIVAQQKAKDLKNSNFSKNEALELIMSENFNIKIAQKAIEEAYNDQPTIEKPKSKIAMLVPTSYDELKQIIEYKLLELGPKKFIEKISKSEKPIVRLASRKLESLTNVIKLAYNDNTFLDKMHEELRPWFEDALADSILLSQQLNDKIIDLGGGKFRVSSLNNDVEINLVTAKSTSNRYCAGSFEDFCLPDQYIVYVAENVFPEARLTRDINSI